MMAATSQMTKEEKEALINQRIEAIRKRNEEILRRYEEIENDKNNAETFSQEALELMKRIPREAAPKITPTDGDNDQPQRESRKSATKQLLRVKSIPINDSETSCEEVNYKPQRLTEADLPPPDPVFSYLTDRLREGAFCAPISPPSRRRSTASNSDMSMSSGRSSGYSSRKHSTVSNSSWTSEASSKCSGFSNYQPPRKYSETREYLKSRRMSNGVLQVSQEESDYEKWKTERKQIDQNRIDNQQSEQGEWKRDWDAGKTSTASSIVSVSENNKAKAARTKENLSDWKKEMKKEKARLKGNWRERPAPMTGDTAEIIQTDSISDDLTRMTITADQDPNNNDQLINRNMINCNDVEQV